jgi:hypothetical protein
MKLPILRPVFTALILLTMAGCATKPLGTAIPVTHGQHIKGTPQPNRWKMFLEKAERGDIEEVPDDEDTADDPNTFGLVTVHRGKTKSAKTHSNTKARSENFTGKFRPEAKTSYARGSKGRATDIDSLLQNLPSDADMTRSNPELVKMTNHANHELRIQLERRNVMVNAWLYWEGRQRDNDYHLILGDTSELTDQTIFMNAEISALPKGKPNARPFVGLRSELKQLIATHPNKRGAFVTPVPVDIAGSLLWDGEHRNPNNVGPKKPVDIRPKKAWEIHPIHDLGF